MTPNSIIYIYIYIYKATGKNDGHEVDNKYYMEQRLRSSLARWDVRDVTGQTRIWSPS
jgi:hypothetical protein